MYSVENVMFSVLLRERVLILRELELLVVRSCDFGQ